jgi:hypothetical protein
MTQTVKGLRPKVQIEIEKKKGKLESFPFSILASHFQVYWRALLPFVAAPLCV